MEALAAKWLARSTQQNSWLVAAVAGSSPWRRAGRVERAAGLVAVVVMAKVDMGRLERERVGMERMDMGKRDTDRRNKNALTQKALA